MFQSATNTGADSVPRLRLPWRLRLPASPLASSNAVVLASGVHAAHLPRTPRPRPMDSHIDQMEYTLSLSAPLSRSSMAHGRPSFSAPVQRILVELAAARQHTDNSNLTSCNALGSVGCRAGRLSDIMHAVASMYPTLLLAPANCVFEKTYEWMQVRAFATPILHLEPNCHMSSIPWLLNSQRCKQNMSLVSALFLSLLHRHSYTPSGTKRFPTPMYR
jgi:hypothetical protein